MITIFKIKTYHIRDAIHIIFQPSVKNYDIVTDGGSSDVIIGFTIGNDFFDIFTMSNYIVALSSVTMISDHSSDVITHFLRRN